MANLEGWHIKGDSGLDIEGCGGKRPEDTGV